jgi:F-type H+-transporting ATPase subunit b
MQEIFQQLQGFFIGAVPTALLFIVLVLAYQILIQGPLTAVLKERRARTQGAVDAAHKAIEEAEKRAIDYDTKLRLARAEIFKAREERIKQWSAERDAALDSARKAAGVRVSRAKAELEVEAEQARKLVEASVSELAGQVVRAVLPATAAGGIR